MTGPGPHVDASFAERINAMHADIASYASYGDDPPSQVLARHMLGLVAELRRIHRVIALMRINAEVAEGLGADPFQAGYADALRQAIWQLLRIDEETLAIALGEVQP